jgi:tetratricopeptide (TPR) repeat protein
VQTGFDSGRASLEKNDFVAAINHFRAVDREQPKYQGVDTLLAETTSRQQKAVEEALQSGQQNEQAGKTRDARQWYQRALEVDPGSAPARERANQARARAVAAAEDLFTKANTAEKIQDVNRARQYLQQIVDTMLPGDEIRDRAAKRMEALKP